MGPLPLSLSVIRYSVYRDEFENDWNPDAESLVAELMSDNQTDKLPDMNDAETARNGRIMMAYHQLVQGAHLSRAICS